MYLFLWHTFVGVFILSQSSYVTPSKKSLSTRCWLISPFSSPRPFLSSFFPSSCEFSVFIHGEQVYIYQLHGHAFLSLNERGVIFTRDLCASLLADSFSLYLSCTFFVVCQPPCFRPTLQLDAQ